MARSQTSYKPGESGNPGGRPRGLPLPEPPSRSLGRTERVAVYLSPAERQRIEQAARQRGIAIVSPFVRILILDSLARLEAAKQ